MFDDIFPDHPAHAMHQVHAASHIGAAATLAPISPLSPAASQIESVLLSIERRARVHGMTNVLLELDKLSESSDADWLTAAISGMKSIREMLNCNSNEVLN